MKPVANLLPDGRRLHLQHGPIDLIIGADGQRNLAFKAASCRFETILNELVADLPLLRSKLFLKTPVPQGAIARRMYEAALPYCVNNYVTPMAAVAGSVADEVLEAMCENAELERAYVNNGGDIALYLAANQRFSMAMFSHDARDLGRIEIKDTDSARGIATSGRHGRSLSRGIADSVTALARNAAQADVAATLTANKVNLQNHPAIVRKPAIEMADDSDLGNLSVVSHCGRLCPADISTALDAGLYFATDCVNRDLTCGAALFLQKHNRTTEHKFFCDI